MGFSLSKSLKKVGKISGFNSVLGLSGLGGLLGGAKGAKIPAADKAALAEANRLEEDRKTRLLEQQQRRSRVALGSVGGIRQLVYGTSQTLGPATPAQSRATAAGGRFGASAVPGGFDVLGQMAGVDRARRRKVA